MMPSSANTFRLHEDARLSHENVDGTLATGGVSQQPRCGDDCWTLPGWYDDAGTHSRFRP